MKHWASVLIAGMTAQVHAALMVDTNIAISNLGTNYALTVYQDAARTDFTSVFFEWSTTNLIFRDYNIDESSDWYFADYGDVFTTTTITQGTFTLFNQVNVSFNVGYDEFYLGVNTGIGFTNSAPRRDVYGWVLLTNAPSGLSIVNSAVAYNEGGIVIGQLQVVPEASSLALLLFASVGLLIRQMSRSHHNKPSLASPPSTLQRAIGNNHLT